MCTFTGKWSSFLRTQHFQNLAKSQEKMTPELKELMKQSTTLVLANFQKEEVFLDVPFSLEEVEHAVNKKKSAGPDDLMAEHLKYGGQSIIMWLTGILNSIIDVEQVPACFKPGVSIPIYKGGGKDPLNVNSYRGTTLNSFL